MLQFLSRKFGQGVTHVAASVLYSTIEGVAFLFRPYGIAAILGSEIIVSTIQNPQRVGKIFAKSIGYIVTGRICLTYIALLRRNQKRYRQSDVLNSIWDWKPPEDDLLASNTWFVLKELVFTLQKLKEEYPEIETYLSRPEFSPMEMAPRLYYYLKKQDSVGHDDVKLDESHRALESEEEQQALMALQELKVFCMFAYDLTEDDALEKALFEKGYVLLGARYNADLVKSGSPAFYLAARAAMDGSAHREIMLCIRGTYSEDDVFIDLFAHGMTFGEHGMAHAGMTKAAGYLDGRFGPFFEAFLNAGGILTITGHSLGAGVGSLLTLKLIERGIHPDKIRCYAYEPPACMSKALAKTSLQSVWSLVNRDDIVPRLGPTPFLNLLHDLSGFDWRKEEDGEMPQILRMLTSLLLKDEADSPPTHSTEQPVISTEYDPVVPGRIIYACAGKKPIFIDQCSPILRGLRLSSTMIKDHFIDTDDFGQALFSS